MRKIRIHLLLFAATCVTTWWSGGFAFAATLMSILVCHELGHYVVARRHGVPVSLPYFIPLPPGVTLGTLGAVIKMDRPISNRNVLFDVGAAGPVAGLVVAIPLLVIGLSRSSLGPVDPDSIIEGNSLLYLAIKYAMFGRWLPGGGIDVALDPMAFAAWVGLLITAINLIPIGQLDGGHVAKAVFGSAHERWSARLNIALPVIGTVVGAVMFVAAQHAGYDTWPAVSYAAHGLVPWCVWALVLALMRHRAGEYHPPISEAEGGALAPSRRVLAIAMLVIFVLVATPVPFRPVL